MRRRKRQRPLVHHSDEGLQYCSVLYRSVHERNGIKTCSMTDGYDCYQNALAERGINGILKNEFFTLASADTEQAREIVRGQLAIYNHERHAGPQIQTPDECSSGVYEQNCQPISGLVNKEPPYGGDGEHHDRGSTTGAAIGRTGRAAGCGLPEERRSGQSPPPYLS